MHAVHRNYSPVWLLGQRNLSFRSWRNKIPTFAGMSGLILGCLMSSCTGMSVQEEAARLESQNDVQVVNVANNFQNLKYREVKKLNAKIIGLQEGADVSTTKALLHSQGFRQYDFGSGQFWRNSKGECPGIAESQHYYHAGKLDEVTLIFSVDVTFREIMKNAKCEKLVSSFTPIIVTEEYNVKNQ